MIGCKCWMLQKVQLNFRKVPVKIRRRGRRKIVFHTYTGVRHKWKGDQIK